MMVGECVDFPFAAEAGPGAAKSFLGAFMRLILVREPARGNVKSWLSALQ
jgi:hypothetical protein